MFSRKNNFILLSVFLVFLGLGLIRSQDAFKNDFNTIAFLGDGHGTIADFAAYNKTFNEVGFWQFLVDRWYPKFGGGYSAPKHMNFFWRITILTLSKLLEHFIITVKLMSQLPLQLVAPELLRRFFCKEPQILKWSTSHLIPTNLYTRSFCH